jgi:elongation factor 1-gamma
LLFYLVSSLAPNSGLLGGSLEDAALIDQWVHLSESEVDSFTDFIRALCKGLYPYNKPVSIIQGYFYLN